MDLLNNGWHGCNGIAIRHTLIERIIALRWADVTETASVLHFSLGRRPSVFPIPPNSPQTVGPLITQALLLRRRCRTPISLRLCVPQILRATYTPHLCVPIKKSLREYPAVCAPTPRWFALHSLILLCFGQTDKMLKRWRTDDFT